MSCIFCKIVDSTLPSYKVYEDEEVLAFLDIGPSNYGHTLVIPKKHFEDIETTPGEIICKVVKVVKKIGLSIKKSLEVPGYNIAVNNGAIAGQIVPHLHFHIIPRYENDGLNLWPQGKYGDGEAEEVLKKIKIQ